MQFCACKETFQSRALASRDNFVLQLILSIKSKVMARGKLSGIHVSFFCAESKVELAAKQKEDLEFVLRRCAT